MHFGWLESMHIDLQLSVVVLFAILLSLHCLVYPNQSSQTFDLTASSLTIHMLFHVTRGPGKDQ